MNIFWGAKKSLAVDGTKIKSFKDRRFKTCVIDHNRIIGSWDGYVDKKR